MAFRIPDSTIEEIRLRTDIVDLISSYGIQVKRAGGGYMACCPFHHEKTDPDSPLIIMVSSVHQTTTIFLRQTTYT